METLLRTFIPSYFYSITTKDKLHTVQSTQRRFYKVLPTTRFFMSADSHSLSRCYADSPLNAANKMYMYVNNLTGLWFSIYNVRKCEVERKTCNPV